MHDRPGPSPDYSGVYDDEGARRITIELLSVQQQCAAVYEVKVARVGSFFAKQQTTHYIQIEGLGCASIDGHPYVFAGSGSIACLSVGHRKWRRTGDVKPTVALLVDLAGRYASSTSGRTIFISRAELPAGVSSDQADSKSAAFGPSALPPAASGPATRFETLG